jgi:hypothetical protein
MLPHTFIQAAWDTFLFNPLNFVFDAQGLRLFPNPTPAEIQLFHQFCTYFRGQWLHQAREWNHFSNSSHRTNNVSEGFNSKIARVYGRRHALLSNFLYFFQEFQYEYYTRQIQLDAGGLVKPKNPVYVTLHTDLMALRDALVTSLTRLQAQYMPHNFQAYQDRTNVCVREYLGAVKYRMCRDKKH